MRCFLPCFRASKRSKHLRSVNATPTRGHQTHVADGASSQLTHHKTVAQSEFEEQSNGIAPVTSNKELTERLEEQKKAAREDDTPQIGEKKDRHGEHDDAGNDNRLLQEEECSESLFSLSIESRKQVSEADKAEAEVNSPMQLPGAAKEECNQIQGKISEGSGDESPTKEAKEGTEVLIVKPEEQQDSIAVMKVNTNEEESSANKLVENNEEKGKGRSPKHTEYRYRDCSYEGCEDMNLNGSDLNASLEEEEDGSDVNGTWVQEYSSESLFSLSTDSRRPISAAEKEDNEVDSSHVTEKEAQGRIPDVLNPIENVVTQGGRMDKATLLKPLKMKKKNDKENINNSVVLVQDIEVGMPLSPEHSVKLSKRKARKKMNDKEQEEIIGVDTSLSSWLEASTPISMKSNSSVGEEQTPKGGEREPPRSNEDRPILGALTVEEIRMYSVTSTSSRRSRSKSPDETPIIGTVGSYWTHRGQFIESNSSKPEKHAKLESSASTLKTRIERAFEASAVKFELVSHGGCTFTSL